MSHWESHPAFHFLGGTLVCGFEALHVQTQHRRQLPDGHLLQGCALALAPVTQLTHLITVRRSNVDSSVDAWVQIMCRHSTKGKCLMDFSFRAMGSHWYL